jgi:hypothetical protein
MMEIDATMKASVHSEFRFFTKLMKNLNIWSKEMRSSPDGCLPTNPRPIISEFLWVGKMTKLPLACGLHLTPLAIRSLESGVLTSPLLEGPTRHRTFAPNLHLHQRKSRFNLHLQYSAKSQSTPRCQSFITTRSDNHRSSDAPVLNNPRKSHPRTSTQTYQAYPSRE